MRKVRLAKDASAGEGSRLEIGPAAGDLSGQPTTLRLASALAMPPPSATSGAAPPASSPAASQGDEERQKLVELERSLAALRAEAQAAQASLAQVQARLREAEAQREANNFALSIAALAAVLAAVVGFALWRRSEARRDAKHWWAPPTGIGATAVATGTQSAGGGEADWGAASEPRPWPTETAPPVETTASPRMLMPAEAAPPLVEPDHEMSVEELIDLEQQAEFFVVLGQDEAAIDLLMGHLRSSGGASPLPYLKLLEIYRRRGEREAFERIRERFNRRFNAYAQEWDADVRKGRTLEDYPDVIGKVQAVWATPQRAMRALEDALFKREAGSPAFDMPAYRELMLLYSTARDLSEREAPADVDLLLPIDSKAGGDSTLTPLEPSASAAMPLSVRSAPVDVDITRHDAGPTDVDESDLRHVIDFSVTTGTAGFDTGPGGKARG